MQFLSMEGELTHIQGLLQLSNNVGMFYPKNKSVPSIDLHRSTANLGAKVLTCLISVNPREISAYLRMECNFFLRAFWYEQLTELKC